MEPLQNEIMAAAAAGITINGAVFRLEEGGAAANPCALFDGDALEEVARTVVVCEGRVKVRGRLFGGVLGTLNAASFGDLVEWVLFRTAADRRAAERVGRLLERARGEDTAVWPPEARAALALMGRVELVVDAYRALIADAIHMLMAPLRGRRLAGVFDRYAAAHRSHLDTLESTVRELGLTLAACAACGARRPAVAMATARALGLHRARAQWNAARENALLRTETLPCGTVLCHACFRERRVLVHTERCGGLMLWEEVACPAPDDACCGRRYRYRARSVRIAEAAPDVVHVPRHADGYTQPRDAAPAAAAHSEAAAIGGPAAPPPE